jgi:hypothetical protein
MLTVRDEQLLIFRDAASQRYEERMVGYVRQAYPLLYAQRGDDATTALVRKGMALARGQGIDGVGSVSVVIDLMARFGDDFEASGAAEWIRAMLARRDLPDAVRIESIIKHLNAKTGGRVVTAVDATRLPPTG